MSYVTLPELSGFLGVTDTIDDATLTVALNAAHEHIDRLSGRSFGRVTDTRTFAPATTVAVFPGDLVSVTTVKTDDDNDGTYETTWTVDTDYQLYRASSVRPYTVIAAVGSKTFPQYRSGRKAVQVAGVFGWPSTPDDIKLATLILASRFYKRKDSPEGVLGSSDFGGAIRITPGDRDVLGICIKYRKRGIA